MRHSGETEAAGTIGFDRMGSRNEALGASACVIEALAEGAHLPLREKVLRSTDEAAADRFMAARPQMKAMPIASHTVEDELAALIRRFDADALSPGKGASPWLHGAPSQALALAFGAGCFAASATARASLRTPR